MFCAGFFRRGRCRSLGKNENADLFAATMRERAGAADHLVGLLWINSEPERHGHCLVELRRREFLQGRDRLLKAVNLGAIHLLDEPAR